MPCNDYMSSNDESAFLATSYRAMLCAVLTAIESMPVEASPVWNGKTAEEENFNNLISDINFKEAGITENQLRNFWADHKKLDKIRRDREAKIKNDEQIRQNAIKKLTPEERSVLGLE